MYYPEQLAKLIESFQKLPQIGQKTATRLAFHVIGMQDQDVNDFAANLLAAKRELQYCKICGNLASGEICEICADSTRDKTKILVVEEIRDVTVFERVGEYNGLYHVLHGTISVFDNVTPDDINIKSLITRLMDQTVTEVILATNATSEGETTAMYLSRLIKPAGIKVTRLASGLAVGSDIEYANEVTLIKAIENRQEL
jgi:recombination protein RecR